MDARPLMELIQAAEGGAQIIPSHIELSRVETQIGKNPNSLNRLNAGLAKENLGQNGQPLLIDCCPNLGVLSLNAIFAADRLLIPISTDYLAMKSVMQVEKTLRALEPVLKRRIERRFVVTRFDTRRKMSWEIFRKIRQRFSVELCETRISENVSLAESPAHNRDIFSHAPQSRGAQDYEALFNELATGGF
jgi:chromosome partitioning protein